MLMILCNTHIFYFNIHLEDPSSCLSSHSRDILLQFGLCNTSLIYKAFLGLTPCHFCRLTMCPRSAICDRPLCSLDHNDLFVPWSRTSTYHSSVLLLQLALYCRIASLHKSTLRFYLFPLRSLLDSLSPFFPGAFVAPGHL